MSSRDLRHVPVHELIRRFARHRAEGDERAAVVWEALVIRTFDRVRQSVSSFTFPNGGRLPAHQRDDAVQDAYLRMRKMAKTFAGASEGEYFAALATCVWYACMDLGRAELSYEKHVGGSLDEPAFEEGDRGRFDAETERDAWRRREDALDKLAAEAEAQRERELVVWAIGCVKNDSYREMLELTLLEGLDGETIAARIGIAVPNVYQRRKRALEKLEEVLRDHRP